jgi:hypothetical protein
VVKDGLEDPIHELVHCESGYEDDHEGAVDLGMRLAESLALWAEKVLEKFVLRI